MNACGKDGRGQGYGCEEINNNHMRTCKSLYTSGG